MDTTNNTELAESLFVTDDGFIFFDPVELMSDTSEDSADSDRSEEEVDVTDVFRLIYALGGHWEINGGGSDEKQFLEFGLVPQFQQAIEEASEDEDFDLGETLDEILQSDNSFEDFESTVAEQEENGLELIDVNFVDYGNGEGKWNSFYTEEASTLTYVSGDNYADLTDLVNEQINEEDRRVVNIEYGDGTWVATLDDEDIAGRTTASGKRSFEEIISEIERRDEANYDLVDLEYGNGEWFAVFDTNRGESTYTTSEDYETFEAEIEAQEEDGFDLIDVEYVDDSWYGVFSNVESIPIEEVAEPSSSSTAATTSTTTTRVSQPTFSPPVDLRFNAVLANSATTFNNLNF